MDIPHIKHMKANLRETNQIRKKDIQSNKVKYKNKDNK